jgi:phage baseplate assembly protein V
MDEETAGKLRGMVRLSTLKNVKDDGQMQTASIEVADGIWRDDVEIHHPYGFAAYVPADGALGIVLAIGGDEGNLAILPVGNPSKRMGKLSEGDAGMYNQHGDKFIMTNGGVVNFEVGAEINIKAPGNVNITCKVLAVTGDITATGDISDKNGSMQEMRDDYNQHGHPDGPDPAPQMI